MLLRCEGGYLHLSNKDYLALSFYRVNSFNLTNRLCKPWRFTKEHAKFYVHLQHSLPDKNQHKKSFFSKGCHKFDQEENETPILHHPIQWFSIPFDLRRIQIHNGAGRSTLILEWPSVLDSNGFTNSSFDDISICGTILHYRPATHSSLYQQL